MKRFALLALFACAAPDSSGTIDPIGPDRATFEPVARVLVARCGSLDCHGSAGRNMRLYGFGGLRLPSSALAPDDGDIRPAEVEANYEAVVSLEPEVMRDVVLKRAGVGTLTFVRKGRGDEEHKGLRAIREGDVADRCIVTWLSGSTDVAACTEAAPPRL